MKIFVFLATLVFFGFVIVKNIQFEQDCGGYLERAANANTIEIAGEQLDIAISYIEANKLTSGYTSIIYRTPDEDVGYWYNNLKAARSELASIKPDASQLEKTNVLMKLRETLTDSNQNRTHVVMPSGIALYPNNAVYAFGIWLALILDVVILGVVILGVSLI